MTKCGVHIEIHQSGGPVTAGTPGRASTAFQGVRPGSLSIARFPMIGIETTEPTQEHYRREAAKLFARARKIEMGRKHGGAAADYIACMELARRFERIAMRRAGL